MAAPRDWEEGLCARRVSPLHFSQWWSKNAKSSGQSNARLMWPPEMTVQHDYFTESYFTDVEELIFWAFWQCNKLHLRVYKKCGKLFSYCLPHWDFRKSITLKQVSLINSPVKPCCITVQILSNHNSDSELCESSVNILWAFIFLSAWPHTHSSRLTAADMLLVLASMEFN